MHHELPSGAIKNILSRNVGEFPTPASNHPVMIASGEQAVPKFEELIPITDNRLLEFGHQLGKKFGIKAPPLYYLPNQNTLTGNFDPLYGFITLSGPINSVSTNTLETIIGHEFGHGLHGKLDTQIRIHFFDKPYRVHLVHQREFFADGVSALVTSINSARTALAEAEKNQPQENQSHPSQTYPTFSERFQHLDRMEKSSTWTEYIEGRVSLLAVLPKLPF